MKTKMLLMMGVLGGMVAWPAHAQTGGGAGGAASGGSAATGGASATGVTSGGQAPSSTSVAPIDMTPMDANNVPPSTPTNVSVPGVGTLTTPADNMSVANPTVPAGSDPAAVSPTTPVPAIGISTPGSVAPVAGAQPPRTRAVSPGTQPIGPAPLTGTRPSDLAPSPDMTGTGPSAIERRAPPDVSPSPQVTPQPVASSSVVVTTPPPPARPETMTTPTSDGQTWVPGHYTLQEGQWLWVNGQWAVPPTPNAVWVPGRYDEQSQRWTEGYWDTTSAPLPRAG